MSSSIHGHEVMHLMLASGASYTPASLRQAIHDRFGVSARFHTCSAENLSADDLIAFLADHGKFSPTDRGFTVDASNVCRDDGQDGAR